MFEAYRALRRLGINIDVVGKNADFSNYRFVAAPVLFQVPEALQNCKCLKVFGPRAGAKTPDFSIPDTLPPGLNGLNCKVTMVESLRPDMPMALRGGGKVRHWFETLETDAIEIKQTVEGYPVVIRSGNVVYVAGQLDPVTLGKLYASLLSEVDIETTKMPEGVRQRTTARHRFVFNHSAEDRMFQEKTLRPASVLLIPREHR